MSDLEAVMERLLSDPWFQGALARDPDTALAGYTLTAEDRQLLGVPLVTGSGGERTVELRTTKSGVVGMLGPVVSAFGVAAGGSMGSGPGGSSMGSAAGDSALGPAPGSADAFGQAPRSDSSAVGEAGQATESFGAVGPRESFGTVAETGTMGSAPSGPGDYSTLVDVDGDGSWDAHTVHGRSDGGVDIYADMDNDGVVDFVGHDDNRDGLVDSADYDTDRDGVMDTRMYDDNDDGWMDRSESIPPIPPIQPRPGEAQSFGNAPGPG